MNFLELKDTAIYDGKEVTTFKVTKNVRIETALALYEHGYTIEGLGFSKMAVSGVVNNPNHLYLAWVQVPLNRAQELIKEGWSLSGYVMNGWEDGSLTFKEAMEALLNGRKIKQLGWTCVYICMKDDRVMWDTGETTTLTEKFLTAKWRLV